MSKYVEVTLVQKTIMRMTNDVRGADIAREVGKIPTADVQEVKHAKWIPSKKQYGMVICSNCHRGFCCDWIHYKYCYECGAKMDLEDNK